MTKQRRTEQITTGRGHPSDTAISDRPDASAKPSGLEAESPPPEGVTADREALGKYWIVIIFWTIGFGMMVAFEVIAAVFRG